MRVDPSAKETYSCNKSVRPADVGSVLFVLSDSVLALNRFRRPFATAQLLVLSTYYLAQWLIAWSVGGK